MANNIARLSISSPSKPNPNINFNTPSPNYRSHGHLTDTASYYNSDSVNSDGYFESPVVRRNSNIPDMTTGELAGSPMQPQPPQMKSQSQPQSYHHSQYFITNYSNSNNGSGTNSARHSFSGPASPHHQPHQYHHAQQQQQPQQQPYQAYHHHQLPVIPTNKIPYSSSGYMLNSPSGNVNPIPMYHHIPDPNEEDNDDNTGSSGNVADNYANYSSRYKLTV